MANSSEPDTENIVLSQNYQSFWTLSPVDWETETSRGSVLHPSSWLQLQP
jgi:hypothetical protein